MLVLKDFIRRSYILFSMEFNIALIVAQCFVSSCNNISLVR
jgi:hypothetical protein